jgi:hypothetical protein
MKRLAVLGAALGALALAPAASAGGLAAFTLGGPPAGIRAGDVWLAQLRVVSCLGQPGTMVPSLVVYDSASGRSETFRAAPTGRTGLYTARVVFRRFGNWSYRAKVGGVSGEVKGPVAVAPARKMSRLTATLPPLGAVLLVFGTGLALRRRRR